MTLGELIEALRGCKVLEHAEPWRRMALHLERIAGEPYLLDRAWIGSSSRVGLFRSSGYGGVPLQARKMRQLSLEICFL